MTEKWLTDANDNRCSVEYFGSEEKAQAALDFLKNCINCINCSNCVDCHGCRYCRYCSDCSYCSDCRYCRYCSDCSDQKDNKDGGYKRPATPVIENIHQAVSAVSPQGEAVTINLAMMLRRLIWQINKMDGDLGIKVIAGKAKELLKLYGLESGDLLREKSVANDELYAHPAIEAEPVAVVANISDIVKVPDSDCPKPPLEKPAPIDWKQRAEAAERSNADLMKAVGEEQKEIERLMKELAEANENVTHNALCAQDQKAIADDLRSMLKAAESKLAEAKAEIEL